ncbi:hypothetical protein IQ273_09930 [Nodosilinea sp. LEGE 07298]|uniref:hypothetical protein n=1 Tax=Nodosilinea sp. LEGE 07298 TaxID=2777970 RepID=UPI00187F9268|nr:hypothetical protein [Nodosilinea sp. LEGE 07298]MBE9109731.1 hypothetical protein [Nodosilinea sp. LEGE 07298]
MLFRQLVAPRLEFVERDRPFSRELRWVGGRLMSAEPTDTGLLDIALASLPANQRGQA